MLRGARTGGHERGVSVLVFLRIVNRSVACDAPSREQAASTAVRLRDITTNRGRTPWTLCPRFWAARSTGCTAGNCSHPGLVPRNLAVLRLRQAALTGGGKLVGFGFKAPPGGPALRVTCYSRKRRHESSCGSTTPCLSGAAQRDLPFAGPGRRALAGMTPPSTTRRRSLRPVALRRTRSPLTPVPCRVPRNQQE